MALRPIFYDTETTGVRPDKDRIVEIAAYDPIQERNFTSLVNPGMPIPKDAMQIHGITDEMVANAPSFGEAGRAFFEFCQGEVVLIAHNNDQFDKLFLSHESERNQLLLPSFPMLDSLKWARKYRPDLPKHSLQFLRQIYGVEKNNAHRALDDVMVLAQVFLAMIDDLPLEKVIELMSAPTTVSIVDTMPFGKHQGKPLSEIPPTYILWLKDQGALEKPENASLKASFEKLGLLAAK